MKITGTTKLLGVIGDPIGHSLSPLMHNAALTAMGWDYVYLPLPIAPVNLGSAIAGLAAIGVEGFSITIPHKQAIIPFLTQVSELAQAVGAVNTVWQTEKGWHGTNTDVAGFLFPLRALDRDWSQANVVCLGNGGAARAVVAACDQLGCAKTQIVGRDASRLQQFKHSWQGMALAGDRLVANQLSVHDWSELSELLPTADLVVNTTPIGMSPNVTESPLTDELALLIRPGTIAYDLIYVPNPTRFLQQAQAQGATPIDGLEMLVQQGAAALRIWTNWAEVPVDVMRDTLKKHLGLD
jgi:shikimate dehydrogenase